MSRLFDQKEWVITLPGVSREHVKMRLLNGRSALTSKNVQTLPEFCLSILENFHGPAPSLKKERVLSPLARQGVLDALLKSGGLRGQLMELKRLRRRPRGLRRIDHALQAGRLSFAHPEEEMVLLERLEAKLGSLLSRSSMRDELRALSAAFEAWCRHQGYWDLPLLLGEAMAALGRQSGLGALSFDRSPPEQITVFRAAAPEAREVLFWAEVSRWAPTTVFSGTVESTVAPSHVAWGRWHRIDDALESLADDWVKDFQEKGTLRDQAILIPDDDAIRRSVFRVLRERNLPIQDPRDPSENRLAEELKGALLPFEVVASNFDRRAVLKWTSFYPSPNPFVKEIHDRGILRGIAGYEGGRLSLLFKDLVWLKSKLSGRFTVKAIKALHLEVLIQLNHKRGTECFSDLFLIWISGQWDRFSADLELLGNEDREYPTLWWLRRLGERLAQTPFELKPARCGEGIEIFRASHVSPFLFSHSPEPLRKLTVLGLPATWIERASEGDDWFSARERNLLGEEFSVRSSRHSGLDRLSALKGWLTSAEKTLWVESVVSPFGEEQRDGAILVEALQRLKLLPTELIREDHFASQRWRASFFKSDLQSPAVAQFSPLGNNVEVSSSLVDRVSRCSFQALFQYRWKLDDLREAEPELRPEAKGILLHEAVRRLIAEPGTSVEVALMDAWKKVPPRGLLSENSQPPRGIVRRLVRVLNRFLEQEKIYRERCEPETIVLDETPLSLEVVQGEQRVTISGRPDRIDRFSQFDNGLWIIDYKTTSGGVTTAKEMVERGYRLQLPIYALAAKRKWNRPVLGAQFIELTPAAKRANGVFFEATNGKKKGAISTVTTRSGSLRQGESPDQFWEAMQGHVDHMCQEWVAQKFRAEPRSKRAGSECDACRFQDVCGLRRRPEPGSEDGVEGEGADNG